MRLGLRTAITFVAALSALAATAPVLAGTSAGVTVAFADDFRSGTLSAATGISRYSVTLCSGALARVELGGEETEIAVGTFRSPITSVEVESGGEVVTVASGASCDSAPPPAAPALPRDSLGANLGLELTRSLPDPVAVGQAFSFTLAAANRGPGVATGVILTGALPAEIKFLSASASKGECRSGSPITCSLGTLAVDETVHVTVYAIARSPGAALAVASVSASDPDPEPGDNTVSQPAQVAGALLPPAIAAKSCFALHIGATKLVAGKSSILSVRVTRSGARVRGARVVARGAGVSASASTDRRGVVRFELVPKRHGFVRVAVAGQPGCPSARVTVLSPSA